LRPAMKFSSLGKVFLAKVACASIFAVISATPACWAQVPLSAYVNFEGAQTNPIRLSPDGTRLFAVNTADARLSVFDVTTPSSPKLIAEIPVGIEPVSVNPRTNDEAWVVNQESDTVSVVSVAKGIVTESEGQQLREVEALVARVIAVDDFDPAELRPNYASLGHNSRRLDAAAE